MTNLEKLESTTKIQCSDGNWNCNSYMLGMANGMIFALATLKNEDPKYLKAPAKWLDDDPQTVSPKVGKYPIQDLIDFLRYGAVSGREIWPELLTAAADQIEQSRDARLRAREVIDKASDDFKCGLCGVQLTSADTTPCGHSDCPTRKTQTISATVIT